MSKKKGFTLLEILLVIAAIGILASIVIVAINPLKQIGKAENTSRWAGINSIQKALDQYYLVNRSYPGTVPNGIYGEICDTGKETVGGGTDCTGKIDLRDLVPTYIAEIPKDPNGGGYKIAINPVNESISLIAPQAVLGDIIGQNLLDIITSGLVLYLDAGNVLSYPGSGNTWFDLTEFDNDGTLSSGVSYNTDNGGKFVFSGNDQYVNIVSAPSINDNLASDFTYEIWTNPKLTGFQYGKLFAKGRYLTEPGFNGITYHTSEKYLMFEFGNPENLLLAQDILEPNLWYQIVITRLDYNIYFYVNGELTYSYIENTDFSSNYPLRISSNSQPNPDDAHQDVAIFRQYSRGLTEEEVQQNFNLTKSRFGL